jgi:simple sugar transport system permease protein
VQSPHIVGKPDEGSAAPTISRAPSSSPQAPAGDAAHRHRALPTLIRRSVRRPEAGALIGTVTVYAFFAVVAFSNGFVSLNATAGWLNSAAELGIIVIPVAMLLIAGEFDLSVGSVVAATTITIGITTTHYDLPLLVGVGIAFAIALAVGLINGYTVTRTKLPSFIVTLATYLGVAGITLTVSRAITGTTVLSVKRDNALEFLFSGNAGPFQVAIVWWVVLTLIAAYVLTRRVFGNWTLATGGDLATAQQAGVPTDRVKMRLFIFTALGAALVGTIQAAEYHTGSIDQGQAFVFNSIIASVIGGILLGGGYGSALGAMLGAMTYGIVQTGVYYTGWSSDLAQAILGGLLLTAVIANNAFRRRAERA